MSTTRTRTTGAVVVGMLVVALVLAALVSGFASGSPDGLERVAEDEGFLDTAEDSAVADSPLADYGVSGVEDERLGTGIAGVVGVGLTFALGAGLFLVVRRRGAADEPAPSRVE